MAQGGENSLTGEQKNCLTKSTEGHNFLIQGKAGTGKSFIVCVIADTLRKSGKNVQLLCSTGMACDVYKKWARLKSNFAVTVHSFLGIGTASAPTSQAIQSAANKQWVKTALSNTNRIIWDECSMGSSRLLEILHEIACMCRNNSKQFGGCQVRIIFVLYCFYGKNDARKFVSSGVHTKLKIL